VVHRVKGFITRERAILKAAESLYAELGLEVLSPFDVIPSGQPRSGSDRGVQLFDGTRQLRAVEFSSVHLNDAHKLIEGLGLGTDAIEESFEPGTSACPRRRIVVFADDELLGFASWNEPALSISSVRAFLFVRETAVEAALAIDHCIGSLLRTLPASKLSHCELWTSKSQILTQETARRVGFARSVSAVPHCVKALAKRGYNGIVTPDSWKAFAREFEAVTGKYLQPQCPSIKEATTTGILIGSASQPSMRSIDLFALESEFCPILLALEDRRTVLVPIRDKLASVLLPSVEVQSSLFGKEALVHIERAYFGKLSAKDSFHRGALAVFYVSGADGGRGEAVGIARITSIGSGSPQQLHLDLVRQGVLSIGELTRMAKSNRVSYFTFDSYRASDSPVPYKKLKQLGCIGPANLITSQSLPFDKLLELLTCVSRKSVS
jgi:hypothetical protein